MNHTQFGGSAFPSLSHAIITGGTFVSHNTHNTYSHSGPKSGYERLLDAVAPNALHNSGHIFDPPKCHPGTRVAVIETILDWVGGKHEDIRGKDITWLSGAAGSGKSAIGRTVCERCAEKRALLASFFFSSGDPTRNHSGSLAATIAYQLCAINPAIRNIVSTSIDHNPLIFKQSLRTQLLSLVMDPLAAIYAKAPQRAPRLIVIDGLDECLDKDSQRDILESLRSVVTSSRISIRVLICSRPESQITNAFDTGRMSPVVFKIFLGDEYSPNEDIRLYLNDRFAEIRQSHNLRALIPDSWPSEKSINTIIHKASGQFIFAATVMRYLQSSRHRPHQRLEAALGIRPPFKDLPFAELDALYTHIILMAGDPILAVDVLAYPALYGFSALSEMETYLNMDVGDIQVALADLSSLVRVDEPSNDNLCYVSLLHKSFSDFIFDSSRSGNFHRNHTDTIIWHLVRVVQVFSDQSLPKPSNFIGIFHCASDDIHKQEWKLSAQREFVDAVAAFPWQPFLELLSSSRAWGSDFDYDVLLSSLLKLLSKLHQHQNPNMVDFARLAPQFIRSFCENTLPKLHVEGSEQIHYVFAMLYIMNSRRFYQRHTYRLTLLLDELSSVHLVNRTYLTLLDNAEKSTILSKAATYCLEFLCDMSRTEKQANRHLRLGWMALKKRRLRPWRWHMRVGSHVFGERPVILTDDWEGPHRKFTVTYRDLTSKQRGEEFQIYALERFDWVRLTSIPRAVEYPDWFNYIVMLENLCLILPLAARYTPLIQLCKTKSFAPMSMMFPAFSRRARRAIAQYLERMEA